MTRPRTSTASTGKGASGDTNPAVPKATVRPSTRPLDPTALLLDDVLRQAKRAPSLPCGSDDGVGEDVRQHLIQGGSHSDQFVGVDRTKHLDVCDSGHTHCERAGLVEQHVIRPRPSASSAPPPLTMIPIRAARETPATIATGTARIRGHGVATTSTESARVGSPDTAHATAAIAKATGTKIAA